MGAADTETESHRLSAVRGQRQSTDANCHRAGDSVRSTRRQKTVGENVRPRIKPLAETLVCSCQGCPQLPRGRGLAFKELHLLGLPFHP